MADQVPKAVVQERFDRLMRAQEAISLERNRELVGHSVEVTIERGPSRDGRSTGRTRTNKLVHVPTDAAIGEQRNVRVVDARPHYVIGA